MSSLLRSDSLILAKFLASTCYTEYEWNKDVLFAMFCFVLFVLFGVIFWGGGGHLTSLHDASYGPRCNCASSFPFLVHYLTFSRTAYTTKRAFKVLWPIMNSFHRIQIRWFCRSFTRQFCFSWAVLLVKLSRTLHPKLHPGTCTFQPATVNLQYM